MTIMNQGPGTIGEISVNGEIRWKEVVFKKYCKMVLGDYIEIDGEILFKAKKGDKFNCQYINCSKNIKNVFNF